MDISGKTVKYADFKQNDFCIVFEDGDILEGEVGYERYESESIIEYDLTTTEYRAELERERAARYAQQQKEAALKNAPSTTFTDNAGNTRIVW